MRKYLAIHLSRQTRSGIDKEAPDRSSEQVKLSIIQSEPHDLVNRSNMSFIISISNSNETILIFKGTKYIFKNIENLHSRDFGSRKKHQDIQVFVLRTYCLSTVYLEGFISLTHKRIKQFGPLEPYQAELEHA